MSLENELLHLAELDRGIVRAVIESDPDALVAHISDYLKERKRLEITFLDRPAANIHNPEAAVILRKITGGEGLPCDGVISRVLQAPSLTNLTDRIGEDEIQQLGEEFFYGSVRVR